MKNIVALILIFFYLLCIGCNTNINQKEKENTAQPTNVQVVEKNDGFVIKEFDPQEIWPYYINGEWGYFSNDREFVIKVEFDACGFFIENHAWVKIGDQYKIINSKGEFVGDSAGYEGVGKAYNHLIPVKKGDLWGAVDTVGNLIVPYAYEKLLLQKDGFIHIQQNRQWGLLSYEGQKICPPVYNNDFTFEGKHAIVLRGYRDKGVINRLGNEAVACKYSDIDIINDSTFILHTKPNYKITKSGLQVNGILKYAVEYDRIEQLFDTLLVITKEKIAGIVNLKGDTIIHFNYSDLKAGNTNILSAKKDDKWGYINLSNETIIDFQYDAADAFYGRAAIVYQGITRNSSPPSNSGLINYKGELLIPLSNQKLSFLSDEVIMESKAYHKIQLYDLRGNLIDSLGFDREQYHSMPDHVSGNIPNEMNLYEFVNGFAIVGRKGKVGMINTNGEIVIPLKYHHLEPMNEYGYTKAQYLNKYGIVNSEAKEIVPLGYEHIGYDETYDYFYLQEADENSSTSYRKKFKNVGYWNYDGELLSNTNLKEPSLFKIEDKVQQIRAAYSRIIKENKDKKQKTIELKEKGIKAQFTYNKMVVTEQENVIYEYYYDASLNRNGPFFIFKVSGKQQNRYYYIHGRIILWLDANKEEQLIADALFAPENEQHYLARQHKAFIKNAESIEQYKLRNLKIRVDSMCKKIELDIRKGLYKKGDSKSHGMGEYHSRDEVYLDDKQNVIYASSSVSDEGGSTSEVKFYTDGKLIRGFSNKYYTDNTDKANEPSWTSGQYSLTQYYNKGELIFSEKEQDSIMEITIKKK